MNATTQGLTDLEVGNHLTGVRKNHDHFIWSQLRPDLRWWLITTSSPARTAKARSIDDEPVIRGNDGAFLQVILEILKSLSRCLQSKLCAFNICFELHDFRFMSLLHSSAFGDVLFDGRFKSGSVLLDLVRLVDVPSKLCFLHLRITSNQGDAIEFEFIE